MNKVGIIGAMDEETKQLKGKMKEVQVSKKAGMEFYSGILEGKETVVVQSGIGKVNAAICTQILIDEYNVQAVINTGIAGSLRTEINIGDIVLSTDAMHHDMDVTSFGHKPGIIPRMESSIFPADSNLMETAYSICKNVNPDIQVYCGRVVSGDQFINDKKKKQWIVEQFQGFCTEMEGAAIAHTAFLNNVPFLIVRAISDKADDSAQMDYGEFEAKAIEHTMKLILGLIPII
jgi:adenosylhomocysteine nucleosidase